MESRNKLVSLIAHKYSSQLNKIDFVEDVSSGYASRTRKNASADATIAFAVDFSTRGEILTKESVENQKKVYIPVDVNSNCFCNALFIDSVISRLNECKAKTLNIAGNGLYTMRDICSQNDIDLMTFKFLNEVLTSHLFECELELIRSGGQSGFDEAGIKAAVKLGIPAMILAPQGWLFRDIDGNDIRDEKAFKNRFNTI
jgi:hypothetical protein